MVTCILCSFFVATVSIVRCLLQLLWFTLFFLPVVLVSKLHQCLSMSSLDFLTLTNRNLSSPSCVWLACYFVGSNQPVAVIARELHSSSCRCGRCCCCRSVPRSSGMCTSELWRREAEMVNVNIGFKKKKNKHGFGDALTWLTKMLAPASILSQQLCTY